jgi:hypothetical protein
VSRPRARVLALAALVLVEAGWMAFDGAHALVTGDYVTPSSGAYAGQLGPWSAVVGAVGIEPRGTAMKTVFLAYGSLWLAATAALAGRLPRGRGILAAFAAGALWYLPFGTLASVAQLALLASIRGGSGRTEPPRVSRADG